MQLILFGVQCALYNVTQHTPEPSDASVQLCFVLATCITTLSSIVVIGIRLVRTLFLYAMIIHFAFYAFINIFTYIYLYEKYKPHRNMSLVQKLSNYYLSYAYFIICIASKNM